MIPYHCLTIMILEDNRVDVYLLKQALHQAGIDFTAMVFEDGESAFRYIDGEAGSGSKLVPDAAILDLNVPKRNGSEVLGHIRDNLKWRHIPVIVLSSSPQEILHDLAMQADCYITKPNELDEFLKIGEEIRKCIEAAPASRTSTPVLIG